jgi:Zn-dependent peptidase ImmA (M78 family)
MWSGKITSQLTSQPAVPDITPAKYGNKPVLWGKTMVWTKKIEKIQRSVNNLLQFADIKEAPVPVEEIARLRGVQVRYLPFEGDLSGLIFREEEKAVIGVNELHSKTRQRFTIAHELGHVELHNRSELHIDRGFRVLLRQERSGQAVDSAEIEASTFAVELLLPVAMFERDLRAQTIDYEDDELIRNLADRYQVSLQVIVFRFASLGLIEL